MKRGRLLTGAVLTLVLAVVPATPGAAATANSVVTWDLYAQTAFARSVIQSPALVPLLGFPMVSGAVYDAVNAITGTPYQPYLVAPRAGGGESVDAAVATAAYRVLVDMLPEQREWLRAQYDDWLARIPAGPPKQGGIRVGGEAARAMIAARRDDGSFGPELFPVGGEPGQWRPTPPGFANAAAWIGHTRPFVVPDVAMFALPGPPALTSRTYARDVDEVERVGSATSTVRTADQTEAAIWWHDPELTSWQFKRQIATTQGLNSLETARMFAMVDIVNADAMIACYRHKELWSFWRPITAIRQADTDGNPLTEADPDWTPLIATPPVPDYPSGHACSTGSKMATLTTFFGRDDIPFSAFSAKSGTTRQFSGFSQALAELIEARIWGGIHFRTADIAGVHLGRTISHYVTRHYFRPTSRRGSRAGG
jgi:hypothetical protein